MRSILLVITFLLLSQLIYSQNFNQIQGRVIDAKTKEIIVDAEIYVAYSLINTFSDNEGKFSLVVPTAGPEKIFIYHPNYLIYTFPIPETNIVRPEYRIQLEYNSNRSDKKSIPPKSDKKWHYRYSKFSRKLLGSTNNAEYCEILNPEVIDFESTGLNQFSASSSEPFIIDNLNLGYRIIYFLHKFDSEIFSAKLDGTPCFIELMPDSLEEEDKWYNNRDDAYYGSLQDFLTCIYDRQINNSWDSDPMPFSLEFNPDCYNFFDSSSLKYHMVPLEDSTKFHLIFASELLVWFSKYKEGKEIEYETGFDLTNDTLTIDYLNMLNDKSQIETSGLWSEQGIADALPLEFYYTQDTN